MMTRLPPNPLDSPPVTLKSALRGFLSYVWLLIVAILLGYFFVGHFRQFLESEPAPKVAKEESGPGVNLIKSYSVGSMNDTIEQTRDLTKSTAAPSAKPAQPARQPKVAPPAPQAAPGNQAAPAFDPARVAAIRKVSNETQVAVTGYRESGKSALIRVKWRMEVPTRGGDFIAALARDGVIRDFRDKGSPGAFEDELGRWMQADFELLFP